MRAITEIPKLPKSPAIYALCGGRDRSHYIAYVGMADNLRRRIAQHLVTRDSSIATEAAAVGLRPDLVTEVLWWEDQRFTDRTALGAAEIIAFEHHDPALRSRGGISKEATILSRDQSFKDAMELLFSGHPTGRLVIPSIEGVLRRLAELERRVSALELEPTLKP